MHTGIAYKKYVCTFTHIPFRVYSCHVWIAAVYACTYILI